LRRLARLGRRWWWSARRAPLAKKEAIASAFGAALFGVHGGKPAPAR
jgi:hypothetical protein